MSKKIHFILNDKEICTSEHPGVLVLDYLRRKQRLMGTKEGCREGDCGACTVLIGELHNEQMTYKPVTSCLVPLGELYGKHLVTIEGLNMPHLSPVQQAIVDTGATQCGFCTPGIVVSLTGHTMGCNGKIDKEGVKYMLSGHLCRCTGYRSLKQTADSLKYTMENVMGISSMVTHKMLPEYFLDIPERLKNIQAHKNKDIEKTPEFFVAGGTDLYIQKGDLLPESKIALLNLYPEIRGISRKNGHIQIGALTTFEEFAQHSAIREHIPEIRSYSSVIGSLQIRNRATLGGNIINASPIGDLSILLLALESILVLKDGTTSRTVPITTFFKGYKELEKTPTEILTEILIPLKPAEARIDWEKVSKRKHLDVASVNSAIQIQTEKGRIRHMSLAMGGVAPIPLYLKDTSRYFQGKLISREAIEKAFPLIQKEINPISDIRGTEDYKRLLARQLLIAHFTKLFPEIIKLKDFL